MESSIQLPEPNPAVICKPVSDGAVLLSTEDEVYFGLNAVGARIWELLSSHETLEDLTRALEVQYPEVDPPTLRSDVAELLDDLLANSLVKPRGQAPD